MQRLATSAVLVLAYAWWAAGVTPFSALAYVLIALPAAALVVLLIVAGAFSKKRADVANYFRTRRGSASLRRVAPWFVLLGVAVALETLGLALGGRSKSVPTLSTTMDHLLVTHVGRCVLVVLWLVVGAVPLWRLRRFQAGRR